MVKNAKSPETACFIKTKRYTMIYKSEEGSKFVYLKSRTSLQLLKFKKQLIFSQSNGLIVSALHLP